MHRNRFTLVEMLVVIAIIAILASMLCPVLVKAKNSALDLTCSSNMRQINYGFARYVDEYSGYVPSDGVYNLNGGSIRGLESYWATMIYELTLGVPYGESPWDDRYIYFPGGFGHNLFCCPKVDSAIKARENLSIHNRMPYGINCYGFNYDLATKTRIWTKASNVAKPSSTILFGDTVPEIYGYSIIMSPPFWMGSSYLPSMRHGRVNSELCDEGASGLANMGYVDGHVSSHGFFRLYENNANLFQVIKK